MVQLLTIPLCWSKSYRVTNFHNVHEKSGLTLGRYGHQGIVTNISDICMELYRAEEIHFSLLPTEVPQVNGLDIAGKGMPFNHVGGDFYDFFWNLDDPDSSVSIVIGDVSGHGLEYRICQ